MVFQYPPSGYIYFELLGARGKLTLENSEKVVYLCRVAKQPLLQVPTLRLSSNQNGNAPEIILTARLVVERLTNKPDA